MTSRPSIEKAIVSGAGLGIARSLHEDNRTPPTLTWLALAEIRVAHPRLLAAHGVALYHGTKNVLPWRLPVPAVVTLADGSPATDKEVAELGFPRDATVVAVSSGEVYGPPAQLPVTDCPAPSVETVAGRLNDATPGSCCRWPRPRPYRRC